jgi:hypothetical protein
MQIWYVPATGGFWSDDLGPAPADAIGITEERHAALIAEVNADPRASIVVTDGVPTVVVTPLSAEEAAAAAKTAAQRAVDAHVEAVARARGYNSAATLAGYATSTVAAWAAEAAAFVVWRDAVWTSVIATLDAVEAGITPAPTIDALIAGLPAISWPTI